jgi:hypothetical protein
LDLSELFWDDIAFQYQGFRKVIEGSKSAEMALSDSIHRTHSRLLWWLAAQS